MRAERTSVHREPDPLPFLGSLVGTQLNAPPNLAEEGKLRRLPPDDRWTADTWQQAIASAWRERWEGVVRSYTAIGDYAVGVGEIGEPANASIPFCLRHLGLLRDPRLQTDDDSAPLSSSVKILRNSLMHGIVNAGTTAQVIQAVDQLGRNRLLGDDEILDNAQEIGSTMAARGMTDFAAQLGRRFDAHHPLPHQALLPAATLFVSGDGHPAARRWAHGMITGTIPVTDGLAVVPAGSYAREDGIITWCEQRQAQGDRLAGDQILRDGITAFALGGHLPGIAGPVFPDLQERACAVLGRMAGE